MINFGHLIIGIILLIISTFCAFCGANSAADDIGGAHDKIITGGANPDDVAQFWRIFYEVSGTINNEPYEDYDDLDYSLKYTGRNMLRWDNHIGQRKLLLSEMDFMNFINMKDRKIGHMRDCYIIYAGSCPGMHIGLLLDLYPRMRILSIDISELHIYIHDKPPHAAPPAGWNRRLKVNGQLDERKSHYTREGYVLYFSFSRYGEYPPQPADGGARGIDFIDLRNFHVARYNAVLDEDKLRSMTEYNKRKMEDEPGAILRAIRDNPEFRVYHFGQLLTTKLAQTAFAHFAARMRNVYFWSDIRTRDESERGKPSDAIIMQNLVSQYIWVSKIQPELAMIKFRFSYEYIPGSEFADELRELQEEYPDAKFEDSARGVYNFPGGRLRLQTRAPPGSLESRLIFRHDNKFAEFNPREMEEKFFYFNQIGRVVRHCAVKTDEFLGICRCNDCAFEVNIISRYAKYAQNPQFDVNSFINLISYMTYRVLNKGEKHGGFLEKMDKEKYKNLMYENGIRYSTV